MGKDTKSDRGQDGLLKGATMVSRALPEPRTRGVMIVENKTEQEPPEVIIGEVRLPTGYPTPVV